MTPGDFLVGTVSIVFAIVAFAIAVGPWDGPYQLRTIVRVGQKYGKPAARTIWVVIACASFVAGLAIISGVRPGYAQPTKAVDQ